VNLVLWRHCAWTRALEQEVVSILNEANDMTIATVREDGYPQATTVSYVNDGLTIYFGCAAQSQKAKNIGYSAKVSLTVNQPYAKLGRDPGSFGRRQDSGHHRSEGDRAGGADDALEISSDRSVCANGHGAIGGVPDYPGNHFRSRLPQGVWPHRFRRLMGWAFGA
jgi:hypothetical protein